MDTSIFRQLTSGVRFEKRSAAQGGAAAMPVPPVAVASDEATAPEPETGDVMEADNALRKRRRIKVKGSDVPSPLRAFSQLQEVPGCPPGLVDSLAGIGCTLPTPIQRQAIPVLLAGRELLAVAPTGSGKTLAYLLPIVVALCRRRSKHSGKARRAAGPRAAVLSPTRELAAQIARVLDAILPGTGLHGSLLTKASAAGTDFAKVDILVAPPLLVGNLVEAGKLKLSAVRFLVLDEGDRLLDEQFVEQVDAVLAACTHRALGRSLFSASLSEAAEELARTLMQAPLRVTVGERGAAAASVRQRLQFVGSEAGKLLALRQAVAEGLTPPILVFVSSKDRALQLHRDLLLDGLPADSITADQSQAARGHSLEKFRAGRTWVLVTTDLLARGIDFVLDTVVSYDFPQSTTDYVHRIGRTGRAGRTGQAVCFFTEENMPYVKPVANVIAAAGGEVPSFIKDLSIK